MIREWCAENFTEDLIVINLDESTDQEAADLCEKACIEGGIFYRRAEAGGLVQNLFQAAEILEQYSIHHILYMHHDASFQDQETVISLTDLIQKNDLSDFGVIGFNIIHGDDQITLFKSGRGFKLHTLARSPLELGDGWYRPFPSSRFNYKQLRQQPFAVESVMWSTCLISTKALNSKIKIDPRFQFFHAWDDIAFQFLQQNTWNIVVPTITFFHNQMRKLKYNLPLNSPFPNKGSRGVEYLYGRHDSLQQWEEKWGFSYDFRKSIVTKILKGNFETYVNRLFEKVARDFGLDPRTGLETVARKTYRANQSRFSGTYIDQFYSHDPILGPIKYFEDLNL